MCSFVGVFTKDYNLKEESQKVAQSICWICCFSPTVQLLYGILFIQYRYIVYVLRNSGMESGSISSSDKTVDPYSEYGA